MIWSEMSDQERQACEEECVSLLRRFFRDDLSTDTRYPRPFFFHYMRRTDGLMMELEMHNLGGDLAVIIDNTIFKESPASVSRG